MATASEVMAEANYVTQGSPEAEGLDPDFALIMNPSLVRKRIDAFPRPLRRNFSQSSVLSPQAKNEYPTEELEAARAADHTSLSSQFCTPEIWEQYKDKISSGPAKWTLARAINSGTCYPSSFVGCHAGDKDSYDDFKDFFYPVIQAYHKGFDIETTKHVTGEHDPCKHFSRCSVSHRRCVQIWTPPRSRRLCPKPRRPRSSRRASAWRATSPCSR